MSRKSFFAYALIVVLATVVLAAISIAHFPTVQASVMPEFAVDPMLLSNQPMTYINRSDAGVGECGWYMNEGLEHRNGRTDKPDYCYSEPDVPFVRSANEDEPAVAVETTPVVVIEPVADDDNDPVVEPEPVEETCDGGNPGNTKCVGNAGEDPNNRGTMPLDGQGEHGNQGVHGNSDH